MDLLAEDIASKITREPEQISPGLEATTDTNDFYKLHSGEKLVTFTAGKCGVQDKEKVHLYDGVLIIEYDVASKKALRTLRCTRASLHLEGDKLAPTLTMDLLNPTWRRADGSEGLAQRVIIRGLILPKAVTDKFVTTDVLETVSPASIASMLPKGPSLVLQVLRDKLRRKIRKTLAEIKAELNSRLVFGIGCVPLIMIGIGLGIILKGGHLLSAFGASSLPAAVLIVFIMSGYQIARNLGARAGSGIGLMWSGLVFLSLLAVVVYRKLLKN